MSTTLYVKVATGGTVEKPIFEIVRVINNSDPEWLTVKDQTGLTWYCHREDIKSTFPIVRI